MRKIANNPWTPRLQDPPALRLPCSHDSAPVPLVSEGFYFTQPLLRRGSQCSFTERKDKP